MKLEFKKLGDIATYINGYSFKPTDWSQNGKAIIRIQNLNNDNAEFNYFSGDINEKYIVKKGDILISWSASIGVYEWNKEDALLNQHIFKVDFNKEEINKIYFKHMVSIALNKATQFMHGSTMKHITKKYFDDIKIPVPSLEVQKNISDILDKAIYLTSKRKEQLEELDLLVKSKFIEMFGDPINNFKKFDMKKIKEVSYYLKRGISPKYVENSDIKVINQRCIYWKKLKKENCKYCDGLLKNKLKNSLLEDNDILINSTGTGTLGRSVVLKLKLNEIYVADSHVTILRLISMHMNSIFFTTLLEFENIQDTIYRKCVSGSTNQIELSVSKLGEYRIITPPIELQNQFADFVKQVDKLKFEMEKSLKELEDNFNSLMQKAFKGELFK